MDGALEEERGMELLCDKPLQRIRKLGASIRKRAVDVLVADDFTADLETLGEEVGVVIWTCRFRASLLLLRGFGHCVIVLCCVVLYCSLGFGFDEG